MTCRSVLIPIICRNIFPRGSIRLIRDPGGIRTQISDNTYSSVSLNIYSFIELLGDTHCLLCAKIKSLCSLLLKRTCSKRERGLADTFCRLDICDLKICILYLMENVV